MKKNNKSDKRRSDKIREGLPYLRGYVSLFMSLIGSDKIWHASLIRFLDVCYCPNLTTHLLETFIQNPMKFCNKKYIIYEKHCGKRRLTWRIIRQWTKTKWFTRKKWFIVACYYLMNTEKPPIVGASLNWTTRLGGRFE